MRLVVTGAGGMLGSNLSVLASDEGHEVTALARSALAPWPGVVWREADVTTGAAGDLIRSSEPDAVIHCAALTNVDRCEQDPEEARRANAEASGRLAAAARGAGAGFVYVSTDSVFDGARGGYAEDDEPAPVNAYARSKLEGEKAVRAAHPEALVVRTNLFGWNARPRASLAEWVVASLRAGQAIDGYTDVIFNPLRADDLARLILDLARRRASGLYHAGCRNACSKCDFARRLARAFGLPETLIRPTPMPEDRRKARRPRNTVLRCGRIEALLERALPGLKESVRGFREGESSGYVGRLRQFGRTP
jgi:dTDP-4-dehydrorhamnose reductase